MDYFREIAKRNHRQVLFGNDPESGLQTIIAIHDLTLGPALGGCRMKTYLSTYEALVDALRLSRGMTYKAAAAGLDLGGGKSVIIGDPETQKSEDLLRAFGRMVDGLNGQYITAEDVGTTVPDMTIVREETEYVTGLPEDMGGSGDPSPVTALGVFHGLRAATEEVYGSDDLDGKSVAVQGLGKVGWHLAEHLVEAGAELIVADIREDVVEKAREELGAEVMAPDRIHAAECDIFSPCALGAVINNQSIEELKCRIVAGAANNQLADEKVQGPMLKLRDILYAPDFVINAGGLINVSGELDPDGYDREKQLAATKRIYDSMKECFALAKERNVPTAEAAMIMAEERIEAAKR
ncbi:MAG: Glu/Leu/Phe/Val dehydrogenase [bacterium]